MITLAESTVGPNVRTVIIDGRVVMKDRVLLTVDLAAMKERLRRQYGVLMDRFERAIACTRSIGARSCAQPIERLSTA